MAPKIGHLSPSSVSKMKKGNIVAGMSLPNVEFAKYVGGNGVCDACIFGKQSSCPFKPTGHTFSKPLEVVHA